MATLASNNVYLELNGTDMSGYWTGETARSVTNSVVETTAGAGQEWVEREDGLNDYSLSVDVVYDVTEHPNHKAHFVQGSKYTVVYGPESNTAGKPKDEVPCILANVDGPNLAISKDMVMYSLQFQGRGTPTSLIESGTF